MGLERKRLEFSVGIFVIIGVCCLGYLSFTLGNFSISRDRYDVSAIFSTVSGLKTKAQITLAGVNIGEVKNVKLKDDQAEVIMSINKNVKIEEDAIASIKTMGIIGDKYVMHLTGGIGHLPSKRRSHTANRASAGHRISDLQVCLRQHGQQEIRRLKVLFIQRSM